MYTSGVGSVSTNRPMFVAVPYTPSAPAKESARVGPETVVVPVTFVDLLNAST